MNHGFSLVLALASFAACSSSTAPVAEPRSASGGGRGGIVGSEDCDGLVILTVTPATIELDRVGRSLPREGGAFDAAALRAELEPADAGAACAQAVDLTARGDVTYEDLVAVMDVAVEAGRSDIGLFGRQQHGYPSRRRLKQPTDGEVIASLAKPSFDPATVPVAVISTTTIELRVSGAKEPIVIDDQPPLGDDAAMQGLQEQLREARSAEAPGTGGLLVLQADRTTPAQIVIETSNAMRAAGYERILFAVEKRGGRTP
ncbi:MAG TPA: biopolymer transporter ExbD [Kofleriaceae bacterium]|nr:biopolymer transporter ExbD [Kofleriaceae bacterium]